MSQPKEATERAKHRTYRFFLPAPAPAFAPAPAPAPSSRYLKRLMRQEKLRNKLKTFNKSTIMKHG